MAAKRDFCRFSEIEDWIMLGFLKSFGRISKSQISNFQKCLEKNLDIVSKKERHFGGGVFTELLRKKRIKLITYTVKVLETRYPAWFDAYLRL